MRYKEKEKSIRKTKILTSLFVVIPIFMIFAAKTDMNYNVKQQRTITRCLECGNKITYGRTDKKFCCEDCRTRHHNHLVVSARNIRRKVLSVLEKNHEILNYLIAMNVTAIPMSEILMLGFNPKFMTSTNRTKHHDECTCFDIAYNMTPGRISGISKIKNVSVSLPGMNI